LSGDAPVARGSHLPNAHTRVLSSRVLIHRRV
jgi:hypothetical protein